MIIYLLLMAMNQRDEKLRKIGEIRSILENVLRGYWK